MQPKFTLKILGFFSFRITALIVILALSTQFSFSQTKAEIRAQQGGTTMVLDPSLAPAPTSPDPTPLVLRGSRTVPQSNVTQRGNSGNGGNILNAPTVISTLVGSTGYAGDVSINNTAPLGISFVIENTTAQTIKLTDLTHLVGTFGGLHPAGTPGVSKLFFHATSVSGNYDLNAGWVQVASGTYTVPAANTELPVISSMCFMIPAGAQYRFVLELSRGLVVSANGVSAVTSTPNIFSAGGVNLKVGDFKIAAQDVGFIGVNPVPAAGNHPAFYCGSIAYDLCSTVPATQPIVSSVPSTTCSGSPITLSVISGTLNGACTWTWYAGGCGTGAAIGTGTSITVAPGATTTYYVRGEAACTGGTNGPCGQQTVTVTPCTCLSPDVATICSGSVQRLSVTPTGATTQTFGPGPGVTISTGAAGNGTPYPSVINTAGLPTAGVYVQTVTINGYTHTFSTDVDIALVSPTGQMVVLMSDAGGNGFIGPVSFNITDGAPAIPGAAAFGPGAYSPTNLQGALGPEPDVFPAPGIATPTGTTLSSFSSSNNPNGQWRLLVVDDFDFDGGSITSWSITFRIVPTASWTASPAAPNTMFTNPGASNAYVAGSQADAIWVNPTTTTTYTATFASGPCAPTQSVTVTVLPRPNIQVTPNGACAPVTLTATGGTIYSWSPSTNLSATTGASVVATPSTDQTYTVLGYAANGCSNTASALVKGSSTASVITAEPPMLKYINEGFDAAAMPAQWSEKNLSNPIGTPPFNDWHQGTTGGLFTPHSGADFREVAFFSGSGLSDLSNWLISPEVPLAAGNIFSFWTIAGGGFADRMQIRFSTNGASTNVGATETSVGDFTNVLDDINPGYTLTDYPLVWTKKSYTLTGPFPAGATGRFAFRYFVEDGGPASLTRSFAIGVDEVVYAKPLPGLCPNTVTNLFVNITGGVAPYTLVYSNGSSNTIYPGYTSGSPIQVSPAVTTTYTVVSVTGANGCPGTGNTGSVTITVVQPPSITSQPSNTTVCVGGTATFTVGASPNVSTTSYQWQISTTGAGGPWSDLTNVPPYSGVTTTTLTVSPVTAGMNGNRYRLVVNGQCPVTPATSASALLTVNVPPAISLQPLDRTVCDGVTATFTAAATAAVGTVTYQWQYSPDAGITWFTAPGISTSPTYSVPATLLMNNYKYRVIATVAPCATTATSNVVTLTVNPSPTVVISSPDLAITPGQTTTITGTSTPAASATGWSWTLNGNVVPPPPNPPANGPSITVGIDGLGVYQATATTAVTGCSGKSNLLTIGAESSDRVWIYPNPNNGNFQIRLYYDGNIAERRKIRIYNSHGALVAQKEFDLVQGSPSYMSMDFKLPKLAAGTYVAKVSGMNGGSIVSGLFVVAQ